jgi:hypothetical protein
MTKTFFVFIFLNLFLLFECAAAEGCAISPNNTSLERIFTQSSGLVGGRRNFIGPETYNNIGFPSACPRYDYNAATVTSERCAINGVYNASYRVLIFTPLNCPLDDYIPYFILATGGLGFFYLRRKNAIAVG